MYGADAGAETQRPSRRAPRTSTRRLVLDLIRTRSPISRVELAEITGLTPAAITHAVRSLLDDGLVQESGQRERTGGKPRVMLTISPRARCAVGVQLGADWIVVVIMDARGAVVGRVRARGARQDDPTQVVTVVAAHVNTLLRATAITPDQLVGAGLAVPGTIDLDAGAIRASRTLPRWGGHAVRDALAQALGVPVVMDTDATAAAVGEHWSGRTADAAAHCTLYMGAGIGAGFILDGAVHRGAGGNPGPLGRLHLHRSPPSGHPGHAGHPGHSGRDAGPALEDLAAPHAVARRARAALAAGRESAIALTDDEDPFRDFGMVASAAVHGDALAVELVEESAHYLADAVVTVADLLDIDSLALAGPSFSTAGSLYVTVLEERLHTDLYAARPHGVNVTLAAHIADAAAVGAAALAFHEDPGNGPAIVRPARAIYEVPAP
ncbi:ROK family transcriptional regulator [Kineosporia sp. NBRC 101731]|uniref:ROK family transcriptional regulator n=1 Tax=Kineosporia sp. NBRC 101731 TaxID=3032199 RepID=UPI0024A47082|nr:ROK family transcriptional regulator [Kineosporia sp. NBRC 101731]GLY30899.1 sugar kinase [Kineosporia sp. NBRC 101731]